MDRNDNRSPVAINPWPMADHDATPIKKARGGWFSGTPHKAAPDDSEELPLLKLTHFTKKVMVCFDTLRTGMSRTKELLVENPCDFPQELRLEKFPDDKGFSVPEKCWELDGRELMRLPITWTPKEEGNAREMVTFKCEGAFRLQVILLGTAEDPPKKRGPGRRSTFSVHRKAPLKVTQPKATLKPSRPTMILKPKGPQKPKPLGRQPRPSTGKASKDNQENRVPFGTSDSRKPASRPIIPAGIDDADEPHIVLSMPSPVSICEWSPGEEFAALNSSLAEINGDGMPMTAKDLLLENLKRQTLSVCSGMSPLLQTAKPFIFPKPALPQAQSVAKIECSAGDDEPKNEINYKDLCGSPRRLSIAAKTTVTKTKVPDTEQPSMPANVCKNLFSSSVAEENSCSEKISSPQEFEDSLNEPRFGAFPPDEDDKASRSDNGSTEPCIEAPEGIPLSVENHDGRSLDIDMSTSNIGSSPPADIHIHSEVSPATDESSSDSVIVPSSLPPRDNSDQLDASAFRVHTSIVTSRLTNRKRVSDPKDEAGSPPKKLRPDEDRSQVVKKRQPRDRTMNRTLVLRKAAAAAGKHGATAAKVSRQGRPTGQYKAKGPMKGVPMAKLNLLKHNGTAIPRHPMPFAAKNMFYDERWMEKQERGFTRWLNHVLTPDDCPKDPSCKATKIDAGTLCVESSSRTTVALAPSKEDLSLRAYTAKRKLNRLRRGACMLFQSEPIVRVIRKLEAEIEKRRIVVRLDRKLHADYGIKQKLLDMFLSYNPLWLRIGLETTYGEILPIQSNTDVVGLSWFVITRLLGNPDIAARYAHPTVPHLYGPGYEEALSQFTLKKFLVLVFFMDRAKLTRLIDHDPCLFCKDSEFKSSRDVLLHFSREYLRGEGDLTRHLSFMGYSVTHRQTALDEFDFSVSKLATDLRCGVRLARVVELLIHDWTLSSQLRVPAISRLQKIHNVEITLKAARLDGGGVDTRAIVDGHREKTLELLWRIIFQFQISLLLNEQQIKEEIAFLRKNLRLQRHLDALSLLPLTGALAVGAVDGRRDSNEPNVYFKSVRLSLLLKWCQVVCSFYGLKVENFTVAFSDGRALCYLVHHYHPSLLPLSLVHQDTTQTQYQTHGDAPDSGNDDSFDGTWSSVYSPSTGKPGERDKLLANERENFKVLYDKVSELGGVPGVVKCAEMSNTIPDEKVVITYVSYLCARLLDLRTETRAARTIQIVWKAYRLRQLRQHRQAQEAAAQTIQQAVHAFLTRRHHQRLLGSIVKLQTMRRRVLACREVQALRQARLEQRSDVAATSIQACVRGFLARRQYQKTLKAIIIQSALRGYMARRNFIQTRHAVITLQASVRCHQERRRFIQMCEATTVLQRRFRANCIGQKQHALYNLKRSACISLQAAFRGYACRRLYQKKHSAAVVIQARIRGHQLRKRYLKMKSAALAIQRYRRSALHSKSVREDYLKLREAAIIVQSFYRSMVARRHTAYIRSVVKTQAVVRCFIQRKRYLLQKRACIVIQKSFRGYTARDSYKSLLAATLVVQQCFRALRDGRLQQREYNIKRGAIITLQAWTRGVVARKQLAMQVQSTVSIQAAWKMHRARKHYLAVRAATRCLQKHTRAYLIGKAAHCDYLKLKGSAVLIQSCYRAVMAQRRFLHLKASCIAIQSFVRMHIERKRYRAIQGAAVAVQRRFRAKLCMNHQREAYNFQRNATIAIQAWFRGVLVRQQIATQHEAAIQIQTVYRAYREQRRYKVLRSATVCLQSFIRAYLMGRSTRTNYLKLKKATVIIQASYRALRARCTFLNQKQAAVKIQSFVRMQQAQSHYLKLRQAVIIIQTRYRALKLAQATSFQYQIYRGACITLQAGIRSFLVRRQMRKLHEATVQIQKSYRSFSACTKYHKLRNAAVVLQTHWRATRMTREVQQDFVSLKKAAVILQSAYRGKLGRRIALEYHSARIIQSYFRMHSMQQQFQMQKRATIRIQSAVRMHQAQTKYTELRQAATIIQTRYRAQKMAQAVCLRYQIYRGACITLQAGIRGFLVRQQMRKLHEAAVQIQKSYRSFSACTKYHKLRNAAVVLQTYWRATRKTREVQHDFVSLKKAAVILQSAYRGKLGRHIALEHHSARIIQSYLRMHSMRQQFQMQKRATIKIQSAVRMHQAQTKYTELRQAAMIIQTRYRAQKMAQAVCLRYQIYRGACITLQAGIRGFLVRQQMRKLHEAAVQIQKSYRSFSACTKYHKLRNAAVVLQTYWRATRKTREVQQDFVSLKKAAVILQSAYRGKLGRHIALEYHSARIIQSYFRMHSMRQQFQMQKRATIKIQSAVRMHQSQTKYTELRQAAMIIQTRYRAQKMAQAVCLRYQIYRGACITLQAGIRGLLVRQQMRKLHEAAVQIQKSYRSFSACTKYHKLRNAAVVLQTYWRATRKTREVQHYFVSLKKAAVILQSAYRGKLGRHIALEYHSARIIQSYLRMHSMRQQFQMQKRATIKIQSAVRMHQAQTKYTELRQAAMIIQTRYRAQKMAQAVCLRYQIYRGACITLQAGIRGFLVRQQMRKLHEAAVQIQKSYRSFSACTKYHKLRNAAVVLQTHWRATRMTREVQQDFVSLKKAAVIIQSAYRGKLGRHIALEHHSARIIQSYVRMYLMRQKYHQQKHAAIKIQSSLRMYQAHIKYTELRQAVMIIQTRYRAQKMAQTVCLRYQIYRGACITLQAGIRGFLVRQQMRKLHEAAVQIQKSYRSFSARTKYHKLRNAAVVLQTHWRATRMTREAQQDFVSLKKAAVILQSAYRGKIGRRIALEHLSARTIQSFYRMYVMRQQYQRQKRAAIKIQSAVRMHQACSKYTELRQAVIIIQTKYRATKLAETTCIQYHIQRSACITVQAYMRGFMVRQHIQKLHAAATNIQKNYRAHHTRAKYLKLKHAASMLQKYWRATRMARKQQLEYASLKEAAITIQSMYRGRVGRKTAKEHRAARLLQSVYRMYIAAQEYTRLRAAAIRIQSLYQMHKARQHYLKLVSSALAIQQFYRGHLATKATRNYFMLIRSSVVKIQAAYRGFVQRRTYIALKQAATRTQALYRGRRQHEAYQSMKRAAIVLQGRYRAHVLRNQAVRAYSFQRRAAITIQAAYKAYTVRQRYINMKQAATTVQASYRGNKQRTHFLLMKKAATILQTRFRAHLLQSEATRTYRIQRRAAITIQACHRGRLSRQLVKRIHATIKMQSYSRMLSQRRRYQTLRNSANKIRANFKARTVRRDFLNLKHATVVVQTRYRALMTARAQQRKYTVICGATITIQSFFRGHQARKLAERIQAAVRIQSSYRGYVLRRRYQMVRNSALLLQARTRGMIARLEFAMTRRYWQAAVCIQRYFRGYDVRRTLEVQRLARLAQLQRFSSVVRFHLSSIQIQRCYRLYRIRQAAKAEIQSIVTIQLWVRAKLHRVHFLKLRRGIVVLQHRVRRHQAHRRQAAVCIQAQARVWLARQCVKKLNAAALTLQSLWRGRRVRHSCTDKKIAAVRARCIKANKAATEEKKLCNRTTSALDYLLQYRQMSGLLEALISLDVVSRLSATCCLRLVESQAVPVIFTLIKSCNRSLPCMEVIKYSVNILLNLTKYAPTAHAVFDEPESVGVILDLMQMYREKGTQIFAKVCMLIGTMCQDPRRAQILLSAPKNKERLLGINRLTERKYSMDAKRALVKSRSLNRSSMSRSFLSTSALNVSGMPAATPRKRRRVQPEWVLGRGRLRETTDPLEACHFVMDVLKLK